MQFESALRSVEAILADDGRTLSPAQIIVLRAAWLDVSYEDAAIGSNYKASTLRCIIGTELWGALTRITGQKITKKNFRTVFTQLSPVAANLARSASILGVYPASVVPLYGRKAELSLLHSALLEHQCLLLVGQSGVGKRTLVTHLIQAQRISDVVIWKRIAQGCTAEDLVLGLMLVLKEPVEGDFADLTRRLVRRLSQTSTLLILEAAECLLEELHTHRLVPGVLPLLMRLLEEAGVKLLLISQKSVHAVEELSLSQISTMVMPLRGISPAAARQIFDEFELQASEAAVWDEIARNLNFHPQLLRMIAGRVKTHLGGSLYLLGRETMQLHMVVDFFDRQFGDPLFLSSPEQQLLVEIARLLDSSADGVTDIVLIERGYPPAVIENLIASALVDVQQTACEPARRLTLSPLLLKYLSVHPSLPHRGPSTNGVML